MEPSFADELEEIGEGVVGGAGDDSWEVWGATSEGLGDGEVEGGVGS